MDTVSNGKICSKCGTELCADDLFCPGCGEKYEAQSAAEAPGSAAAAPKFNINMGAVGSLRGKLDIKKTVLSNVIPVACFVIGLILFIKGLGVRIPSDYISSYSMTEYVGGDAYNYIIEAGLRGGRIAAALTTKCIYICSGLIIACIAALRVNVVKQDRENG